MVVERRDLPKGTTFTDNNSTLYLEYGITDRLTISGSLPYKWLRSTYRQQVTVGDQTKTRKWRHAGTDWRHGTGSEILLSYDPVVASVQFLYKNAWLYDKKKTCHPATTRATMRCGCWWENPVAVSRLLRRGSWLPLPYPGPLG